MAPSESFYEIRDEVAHPTELTRGPWDPAAQHAGPPAALLARALARAETRARDARLARITLEILAPVPLEPLVVSREVVRDGRSVSLVRASLARAGLPDRPLVQASGWLVRSERLALPPIQAEGPPPDAPEDGRAAERRAGALLGYMDAVEVRFVEGGWSEPGPAVVWMRPRVALVAGEELAPLERLLLVADSGNGVSAALPWREWLFINVELTVHVAREPRGEWIRLAARTQVEPDGIGLAEAALADADGPVGRAAQALFVGPRSQRPSQ